MKKLYSLNDVVANVGLTRKVLLKAILEGDLSTHKMGRHYYFSEDQVEDYLQRRTLTYASRRNRAFKSQK